MAKRRKEMYPDWVDASKKEVHESLFAMIQDFDNNVNKPVSTANLSNLLQYTGSYLGTMMGGAGMSDVDRTQQLGQSGKPPASLNLTAAIIDTLVAKLSSLSIVPKAITNKGNAKGRQLAEDLNDVISGLSHKFKIGQLINLAFRDAMINKVGYIKVVKDQNKKKSEIKVERIFADEVVIDPADGYYNNPYKMVHRKVVPISVAMKMFPKFATEIQDSQIIEVRQSSDTKNYTPSIIIAEAWCRNSYIEGGRHVIAIENCTILDEEYDKDYFPIIKMDYNEPVIGYLGQSLVDELAPIQNEVDRIVATMQAIMKLVSVPRVFYDINSQMNPEHFTNKVGIMVGMDLKNGVAPIIHNGNGMPPELPKQLEFLIGQMYARAGLTQMDTQGQAPQGLESGEALKTMGDIKSERWQSLKKNYEIAHTNVMEVLLKEMSSHDIKINTMDKVIGLKTISSKVIPKDFNSFILKVLPVSSLPTDPAGKIDTVERWVANGWVDKNSAAELLQMPDLESYVAIQGAPRKFIEMSIEDMLNEGEYIAPEPYDNIDFALSKALQYYAWERMNDKDETKLKLLRRYINDCKRLIQQLAPQQPVQPQGENNGSTKPTNTGSGSGS
jgi:hypothetical protein